ncbi:MATE family efflux transporter [Oscillospiraceae bacterium 42-9]
MQIQLSDHFTYKKLLRFAVSPIMMMIFTSIYGVVDGLFVSNFVGKVPFAAINLIMPFTMILGGMGFMVGTGGSALVAKTLGEGDKPAANRYFTMMVLFTLLLGVGLSVFGIAAMPQAARLLGATDAMMEDCVVYGRVVVAFTAAFMLQNVFQTFLSTAEKPKLGLFYTVAAGVANMALDALFIAVFRWGVAGAALATGISQLVGGVLPLFYFLRPNSSLLRLTKTRLELRILLKACGNGSSELMSNISGSVVGMLYNYQLLRFAGEDGVAVYGVLMYVSFIFVAAFIGYTVASTPIVGYHHGAGNHPELKSLLKKSVVLMLAAGVLMMVLSQVLARPLANVFVGYDQELSQMTQHAFMVFSWSFLLAGFNIFVSSFFTALNNGAISAAISFLRSLVFQIICVLALPALLGLDGIWWSVAVADVFACAISIIFLFAKRKKYHYM